MSGRQKSVSHGVQGVFVFVLLGAFAVMSTLMVLLGAQMYHRTVEFADGNNDKRVLGSYVRSMVRAYDRADAVSVEEHDGVVALAMRESFDGEVYVMRLYEYEGNVCEQYTEDAYDFDPALGDVVCAASQFEPVLEGNTLKVSFLGESGEPELVIVALRAGGAL